MSPREQLSAAILAALDGQAGLSVFDAPPVRAAMPYAVIAEPELRGFDAAGLTARQARIAVELVDAGERPVRLRALQNELEERVLAMAPDLGAGWRLGPVMLGRSRVMRTGETRWRGASEFAAVIYRANS